MDSSAFNSTSTPTPTPTTNTASTSKLIRLCSCRRVFQGISILLIATILTLVFAIKDLRDLPYIPLAFCLSAFIVFVNFPHLVIMLHSRPIYYDDLIIKHYNDEDSINIYDDSFRHKYQTVFRWIVTVTSSCMIGVTVSLWFFRDRIFSQDEGRTGANFAVIGIIGGLLKLYYDATMLIGRGIMIILRWLRRRAQQHLRHKHQSTTVIELSEYGIRCGVSDAADAADTTNIVSVDDNIPLTGRSRSFHNLSDLNDVTITGLKPSILMPDIFND